MSYVFAEEANVTQTGAQERTRMELNSSVPASDFAESRNREEHTERYKIRISSKTNTNTPTNTEIETINSATGSVNRVNTTNHYMQGNAATGSMSRQNNAGHSMGGGRH